MTEVTPGIHWLKLPISLPDVTLPHVNAYLVRGDHGYLLIDTGWNTDESLAYLQEQLAQIGADIKDISRIVVTHIHPDHYGLAGRLKQLAGTELSLHGIEKELIESRYINMDDLLEQTSSWLVNNGVPLAKLADIRNATLGLEQFVAPVYPDITLRGGEIITTSVFRFQVLWTPGHSPGHICLYEPDEKVLISGDHILPTITPNVSLHPQSTNNPLGNYLISLHELKKLDAGLILPGHENPFTQLRPRIEEIINHHEARNREILATIKGKADTAYQIAMELTWGENADWHDLPLFHRRLAISETLAHLELMTIKGQIARFSEDGIIYYRQN